MKIKDFFKRLETLFVAITFAESGEEETARDIMKEGEKAGKEDVRLNSGEIYTYHPLISDEKGR